MLRRVNAGLEAAGAVVPAGKAAYLAPFASVLEFNAPVHGTWNIVHTGMLVPQARQIYVCAANCMRGVTLTAAEMNELERFSFVILKEEDLLEGTVEEVTIEGVTDVLNKLPQKPPAVLLFTVCVHHFLGCDYDHIYRTLEERFPAVDFCRCYMDPIMQKGGLTPDQKLRRSLYELLRPLPFKKGVVSLLGSDFSTDTDGDLAACLAQNGYELRQLPDCGTYSAFLDMAEAELFVCVYAPGFWGARIAAKRLNRPLLYLPQCFGFSEIDAHLSALEQALNLPPFDVRSARERAEAALTNTRSVVGETPIAVDATVHPRPLGLTRLLLEHGFRVDTVYLDAVSVEEEQDFRWLQKNAPELLLKATIRPEARVLPRGRQEKVLAIGQKAAWFEQTPHFVNLVQGAGLWGYDGICRLCELMEEAFLEEKDTEDLVPRKGWGCESCV